MGNPGARQQISGERSGSLQVTRSGAQWLAAALRASLAVGAVLNAANFTPEYAPGSLVAITGAGLSRGSQGTEVEVSGVAAAVIGASPFQVKIQLPLDLLAGAHQLVVRSPFGTAEQQIQILETAPAIFVSAAGRGVVANQDGSLNTAGNPARRGQTIVIYATGLGVVMR